MVIENMKYKIYDEPTLFWSLSQHSSIPTLDQEALSYNHKMFVLQKSSKIDLVLTKSTLTIFLAPKS